MNDYSISVGDTVTVRAKVSEVTFVGVVLDTNDSPFFYFTDVVDVIRNLTKGSVVYGNYWTEHKSPLGIIHDIMNDEWIIIDPTDGGRPIVKNIKDVSPIPIVYADGELVQINHGPHSTLIGRIVSANVEGQPWEATVRLNNEIISVNKEDISHFKV